MPILENGHDIRIFYSSKRQAIINLDITQTKEKHFLNAAYN